MDQILKNHPACKAYAMHGFCPEKENDTQIIGNCPFCGGRNKFYVGKKNKQWDCKSCSKEGGFTTFLNSITEECQEHFRGPSAINLSKLRSIKISTFRYFKFGFNRSTNKVCFPLYRLGDKNVHNIRIFSNSKLLSTYTCKPTLFNLQAFENSSCDTIYLCEGEWDALVIWEILNSLGKLEKEIVLAAPGANTFKLDWCSLFSGRYLRVLYDNDDPGKKGANKIFNYLRGLVKNVSFLHWDQFKKDGFDIRDLYKSFSKSPSKTYKYITTHLKDIPPAIKGGNVEKSIGNSIENATITYDGNGMLPKDIYEVYTKYLHLPNVNVIDFIYGTIIANRLSGDPIWSFIVAPSGLTKSEFIMSVSESKGVHTEDNLTSAGLVSGFTAGGIDQSLLPQLNGKMLCIKDFTTMLSARQEQRDSIFGMLRSIYDGVYKHKFGNVSREYRSKFGIIAGVTEVIDVFLENESAIGERFLRYRIMKPKNSREEYEYISRAFDNVAKKEEMRENLRRAANSCLDYDFGSDVTVPESLTNSLIYLSMFVSKMRGSVERDKFTKEILYQPFREIGTRLVTQFTKLLKGISLFHRLNSPGAKQFNIIRELALGTIPARSNSIVQSLYLNSYDKSYSAAIVSRIIGLNEHVIDMVLNSLTMLGVFDRHGSGIKKEYTFKSSFLNIIKQSKVYEKNIIIQKEKRKK